MALKDAAERIRTSTGASPPPPEDGVSTVPPQPLASETLASSRPLDAELYVRASDYSSQFGLASGFLSLAVAALVLGLTSP